MKAFFGDIKIKKTYLSRVTSHEKADQIIKGTYWENGKGCAVGCTVHSNSHAAYETELGIPQIIARLEDGIFENIPNDLAKTWPRRFLEAIKPGADLTKIWDKYAVWLLTDDKYGVIQFAKTERSKEAIQAISDMYLFKLAGADIDRADWVEARAAASAASAAYAAYAAADAAASAASAAHAAYAAASAADAAAYAAYAAAYAAYAYAAASAADAAAYAADAAAYAADAAAYAADAKRTEWRIAQSEKLIELLKAAK